MVKKYFMLDHGKEIASAAWLPTKSGVEKKTAPDF
jgi:hypothetical protein